MPDQSTPPCGADDCPRPSSAGSLVCWWHAAQVNDIPNTAKVTLPEEPRWQPGEPRPSSVGMTMADIAAALGKPVDEPAGEAGCPPPVGSGRRGEDAADGRAPGAGGTTTSGHPTGADPETCG